MKIHSTNRFLKHTALILLIGLLYGFGNTATASNSILTKPPKTFFHQSVITPPYEAHELKLMDQNGNVINVAQLKGKVVFINFWATWCPPCIAEMPNINKLYQDYAQDKKVVFLMISLDRSFDKAKKFLQQKGFDFDIYRPLSNLPSEFQSRGIPNTFVLGKDGKIAFNHLGMGNYNTDKFRKLLDDLKSK